jgi:RHS repeat-associated protein
LFTGCHNNSSEEEKPYYITPVNLTPTDKIGQATDGIDFVSGQALFKSLEAKSSTSKLQFNKVYKSFDDINKSMGTFSTEFDSYIDAKLPERIKSNGYDSAKEACEEGWHDIDSKTFRGLLKNTRAIYNEENTLCDIYDNNQIIASLLTKHRTEGISKKLHTLTEPNGTAHVFYEKDGKWISNTKSPLDFRETEIGFLVSKTNDKAEYVTYDKAGKLTTVVINGQVVTLTYDEKDRLISLTDPYKKQIKLYYNEENFISTIQSPDETNSTYEYNEQGQLISSTTSDGTATKFNYTDNGDLSAIVNILGLTVKSYAYDANGKTIKTAELGGKNSIEIEYGVGETTVKKSTGEVVYNYKVINSLLKPISLKTDKGTTVVEYDSHGYAKQVINDRGIVTRTTYNEAGLLVSKTTNADTSDEKTILKSYGKEFRKAVKIVSDGIITFREFNQDGRLTEKVVGSVANNSQKLSAKSMSKFSKASLKSSALDSATSSYKYDKYGKRTETTQSNGAVIKGEFDVNGNSNKRTNALGHSSETLAFDKAGRPLKSKDVNGVESTTTYDAGGKLLTSTTLGQTTSYEYDVTGFNTKTTHPNGLVESNSYDLAKNTKTTETNRGEKTVNYFDLEQNLLKSESFKDGVLVSKNESKYDSKNRVIETTDALGNKTIFAYNSKGEKISSTDALGRETKFVYNEKGQLIQDINPAGKVTTYSYNADGQKVKVVTPNGAVFGFEYDALGRVTKKINPDRGNTEYTYDVSGNILTETNAKGESKTYTYDIANRKTSVSYNDATLNETYEYDQGENAKGRLTSITDSSGTTSFTYDNKGNMLSKTQNITSTGSATEFITSFSYDVQGRVSSKTYPSGKVLTYAYDTEGELSGMALDGVAQISDIKNNQNGLLGYSYADGTKHERNYDANGRVTKLSYPKYIENVDYNVVNNITAIGSNESNQTFNYDVLSRLVNFRNRTSSDYQNFTYDANGNRLTQNQETNKTRRFTYSENTNTLTGIKYYHRVDENTTNVTKELLYSYDDMGNLVKDKQHDYTYDTRNRLVAIDQNVTYHYNNNNRRVSKTVNGTITYFIYEGHMLLGEYDANGNVLNEYVYLGSTPIAMSTTTKIYKVYADHLNTPRRVADENNNIVWKWESTPFGETKPIGTLEFNLRFSGQYFDSETETHYNINRDYNPIIGRYIQSDPIGLDGGFSTFAYVNGNPIMFVDLEGLFGTQNKPDPVFVDRTNIYRQMMSKFMLDLSSAYYVADDIRNNLRFDQISTRAYSSSSPGYDSRAQTTGKRKGSYGLITYYLSTWENPGGSLLFNYKSEFLKVAFHEIQHIRGTNNGHPYPIPPKHIFTLEAKKQFENFLVTADTYWGSD